MHVDARRRTQTHADADARTRTHADERRCMQNSSAAFYVHAVICLGLETPPTNLQRSELAYPWEALLDSWICIIERSWLYDGLYLVSIACI